MNIQLRISVLDFTMLIFWFWLMDCLIGRIWNCTGRLWLVRKTKFSLKYCIFFKEKKIYGIFLTDNNVHKNTSQNWNMKICFPATDVYYYYYNNKPRNTIFNLLFCILFDGYEVCPMQILYCKKRKRLVLAWFIVEIRK